jgi:hypothetical protein
VEVGTVVGHREHHDRHHVTPAPVRGPPRARPYNSSRSTSSISAIGAPSPLRGPSFRILV